MRKLAVIFLLFLASVGAASAQIQLAPPSLTNAVKAQVGGDTSPNPPAASGPEQPAQAAPADAPKQAPPDFGIVNRVTGLDAGPALEGWATKLNEIEPLLTNGSVSFGGLRRARGDVEAVRSGIDEFMAVLAPKVTEAKAQVDNLGAVPQGGEPEPVAAQRAELQRIYGSLSATRNIAESTKLRATQLAGTIQDLRRRKFAERLFERVPETLSFDTWTQAPGQFEFALTKAWQMITGWWIHLDRHADAIQLLALALIIAGVTSFIAIRGMRHFREWHDPEPPPYWRRSTSAAWVMLLRLLPVAATSSFLYFSFHYQGLLSDDINRFAYSAMRSLLIVTSVYSLITTVLAPRRPEWRLVAMDSRAAHWIRGLVVALAAIYALTLLMDTIRFRTNAPFTLTIVQGFVSSVLIACFVIAILRTPRNASEADDAPDVAWLRRLRYPLWGVAILILVTAVSGYIGLARFISAQLIVTGTILSLLYCCALGGCGGRRHGQRGRPARQMAERAGWPRSAPPRTIVAACGAGAQRPSHAGHRSLDPAAMGLSTGRTLRDWRKPVLRLPDRQHADLARGDPGRGRRLQRRLFRGALLPGLARPARAGDRRDLGRRTALDQHRGRLCRHHSRRSWSRYPMPGSTCPTSRWWPARCPSVSVSACKGSSTISSPA